MSSDLKEIQEDIDKILYRLRDLNDSVIGLDVDDKLKVEAKILIEKTAQCLVKLYINVGVEADKND
mgnify:CR=1 FL=1|jgi:low affinity Fe/Cu permease